MPPPEPGAGPVAAPAAVLFDLDETLTDRPASLRRFAAVFAAAYRERLEPIDDAEIERLVIAADRSGGGRQAPPGPDRHDLVVAEALAVGAFRLGMLPWRSAPTADELAAFWTAVFPGCAAPAEGLHETLAALRGRGVRTGIVTNGVVARQEPKIATLGLDALVEAVVVSEAVGVSKPDRRIFEHALAALGVSPEAAWFVGDNPVTDVLGARAAGLTPVWLRRGAWPTGHAEPELQIETLGELLPLIARPAVRPDEAVGFLYDPASGRVLLNLRSPDKQVHAGKWAFFGGRAEAEDADLVATWCREMREELGAVVDPAAVVPIRQGTFDDGGRWAEFYCPWPTTGDAFALTEGQADGWFTVDEALAHADLAAYVPDSLRLFRDLLVATESKR